jgi:hypothetical protein
VLMPGDENDPAWKPRLSAFTQALAGLGWSDGRNVQIDLRWPGGDVNRMRALAQELVGLRRHGPNLRLSPTQTSSRVRVVVSRSVIT